MPPRSSFIEPCLPSTADQPPSGPEWIHEIKHDGYRLMARRDPVSVGIRLLIRNGHDWASRYPLIVQAVNRLKVRSCLIDGEAVCCNEHGVPSFDKLRHRSHDPEVVLIAFDLLELDGEDLRREPFETRKATLASLLRRSPPGVQFNQHLAHRGDDVFEHACKMGLEGIVSKRLGSRYRSGRSPDWLKFKNPEAPAVRREGKRIGGDDRNCVSLLTLFGPRTGPCPGISASNELIASAYPYEPRVIRGKLYMPAELQSIHKLVLDAGAAKNVNDEMRAVAETLWPDLVHKLP